MPQNWIGNESCWQLIKMYLKKKKLGQLVNLFFCSRTLALNCEHVIKPVTRVCMSAWSMTPVTEMMTGKET